MAIDSDGLGRRVKLTDYTERIRIATRSSTDVRTARIHQLGSSSWSIILDFSVSIESTALPLEKFLRPISARRSNTSKHQLLCKPDHSLSQANLSQFLIPLLFAFLDLTIIAALTAFAPVTTGI